MAISVDAYRARLEAMNADSGEEWYRHFAGLKPTLELAAVDEEFEELFTVEACRELASLAGVPLLGVDFAPDGSCGWQFIGASVMPDLITGGDALIDALIEVLHA